MGHRTVAEKGKGVDRVRHPCCSKGEVQWSLAESVLSCLVCVCVCVPALHLFTCIVYSFMCIPFIDMISTTSIRIHSSTQHPAQLVSSSKIQKMKASLTRLESICRDLPTNY